MHRGDDRLRLGDGRLQRALPTTSIRYWLAEGFINKSSEVSTTPKAATVEIQADHFLKISLNQFFMFPIWRYFEKESALIPFWAAFEASIM